MIEFGARNGVGDDPKEGSLTSSSEEVLPLLPTAAFGGRVAPVGGKCPQAAFVSLTDGVVEGPQCPTHPSWDLQSTVWVEGSSWDLGVT